MTKDYSHFKNIVFDLGGVIVRLQPEVALAAFKRIGMGHLFGKEAPAEARKAIEAIGLGFCSEQDFCDTLRRLSGSAATNAQIEEAADRMLGEIPDRKKEMLMELRAEGHRVFLLSNTFEMHWRYCVRNLFPYLGFNVDDYFDQVFLSQRVHLQKPDPALFRLLLRQTRSLPSETLFIDDLEENCRAAESCGISTFQNKNFNDWMQIFPSSNNS